MPTKTLENSNSRLLISEILRKVSNAKTKAEKIKILRDNNSVALRQLMIINFDESIVSEIPAGDVPYTHGNPYLRLAGYALVDSYDGTIQLIAHGDDFFAKMLESQYADQMIEAPTWLEDQIRYPDELFNWKTSMYNIYHVTDVETFIQANEFY